MFSKIARWFLSWFVTAAKLPLRTITREDGVPYLHRWYLFGEPGGLKYFEEGQREQCWWQKWTSFLPCVYVHRFVSSDVDPELHNHPWEAAAFIVSGGYVEQRRVSSSTFTTFEQLVRNQRYKVVEQTFTPGMVNYLFADTFHRVTLLEDDCWTLIRLGKKVQSWGFWSPLSGAFLTWRDHVAMRAARKLNSKGGSA